VQIAPPIGVSEDDFDGSLLVETAALLHDLGHPPFGHNGENELKKWMTSVGSSFEANAQS
jgi:dGTPase